MKLGHLFDAIEITTLKPKSFPELLDRSWTAVRFGRDMVGLRKNPVALGRKLLVQTDFFKARSGFTDEHRVFFALDDIQRDHLSLNKAALLQHLKWMVDSRRNPATIRIVLEAINLPTRAKATCSFAEGKPICLHWLAGQLASGLLNAQERPLTEALLTGHLYIVAEEAAKIDIAKNPDLVRRVRDMMIMWALLDLQIIAARLFHAEWRALENDDPTLIRLSTVHHLIQKLVKHAREIDEAFATGKNDPKIGAKVRKFLIEQGLEDHARRNGFSMGLTAEEMEAGGASPKLRGQVKRYLDRVKESAESIVGGFEASMKKNAKSPTRTDFAKTANQTGKLQYGPPPFHTAKKVRESLMYASTARFSMPVLTALAYGIKRITSTIGGLPTDGDIMSHVAAPDSSAMLWDEHTQLIIRGRLLDVYRNLFVRDHRRIADDKLGKTGSQDEEEKSNFHLDDGIQDLEPPASALHLPLNGKKPWALVRTLETC